MRDSTVFIARNYRSSFCLPKQDKHKFTSLNEKCQTVPPQVAHGIQSQFGLHAEILY